MRIIVIGAGIGGLAAALTLGRSGFEVQLFEQASVLREIGAGVQISSNATRLLKSESTEADHAIAGFRNSGFRKFLLGRLQFLKTRNVRSDEVVNAHVFYDDNGGAAASVRCACPKPGFGRLRSARLCHRRADHESAHPGR